MGSHHFNGLKTTLLFGFMWAILLGIGYLIGYGTGSYGYILLFAGFGLIMTFVSFWYSDKIAIKSMQAYPVTEQEQPAMYKIVTELAQKAGQPMPALFVSPTMAPNAFATGRNPDHAAVCCTEGILRLLDERELRGVLAHELNHVFNRDILTSSVAAAMGGIITSAAQLLFFMGGGNDRRGGNALGALLGMILAPIASTLIRMAISRTREYDADEDGAKLSEDPLALASALRKLETGTAAAPLEKTPQLENVSHMMIANPFGALASLMSTHPPMDKRIQRLEEMAGSPLPDGPVA